MPANIANVLAIESAVGGGSIALLDQDREVAAWQGEGGVSRSETVLQNISDLFEQTQLSKNSVDMVAVSNGPGSYTGIRIGIASTLGLARALNIPCVGVPLLRAIAEHHNPGGASITAIPIGRNEVCWQAFRMPSLNGPTEPVSTSINDFLRNLAQNHAVEAFLQQEIFETAVSCNGFPITNSRIHNIGHDLAFVIGVGSRDRVSDLTPNYVKIARFANINS